VKHLLYFQGAVYTTIEKLNDESKARHVFMRITFFSY
jgi:hypothetical protein